MKLNFRQEMKQDQDRRPVCGSEYSEEPESATTTWILTPYVSGGNGFIGFRLYAPPRTG